MLDPRIYRTGFVAIALAVVVLAFSLQNQPGAQHTTLVPGQFDGAAALQTMQALAKADPVRLPGSPQDDAVAGEVRAVLDGTGAKHPFAPVTTSSSSAQTDVGEQTLQTVSGIDPGLSGGTIAVIAPRDGTGVASLSATAVLMQLARILPTQSLSHSVMLVSISGSVGNAGAAQLAALLVADHVDAAIVLGDLVGAHVRQPVIVPWSDTRLEAPTALRATLAGALHTQAGISSANPGVLAQLARLAVPLTLSPQGPLLAAGIPAVTLSVSGERGASAGESITATAGRIGGMGRAVLQTVDALGTGTAVAAPSSYLAFDGKLLPYWAIRLLVLALLFPVLMVTVDGVARARRRGHTISGATAWVLASVIPFLLGALVIRGAELISALPAAPPGPVTGNAIPLHTGGGIVLVLAAIVIVASFGLLRPLCIHLTRAAVGDRRRRLGDEDDIADGAGPAVLLVASVVTLLIWVSNPFAAALLVLGLHLTVWTVDSDLQLPRPVSLLMLLLGLVPPGLVVAYYVQVFALSPLDVVWRGSLLLAGGGVTVLQMVEGCVVLGCFVAAFVVAMSARLHQREAPDAITVRGPATYAGPGSLGGTQSAIRR